MCLILLAWKAHPEHALVVAANRDEFFDRPAAPADFWPDDPGLLAGRDLTAQGTWLGMSRSGRFAAITNFRNPAERKPQAPSRGHLVAQFLRLRLDPATYFSEVAPQAGEYNGFGMLAGNGNSLYFLSNRDGEPKEVVPGIHGLSNHLLDTPWPKVEKGKAKLEALLRKPYDADALLAMLADTDPAIDPVLPDTGVGIEWERRLSSIRITGNQYGTRCSTVLRVGADHRVEFIERSWNREGGESGTVRFEFALGESPRDPDGMAADRWMR